MLKRILLQLVDVLEMPFAYPHDWKIVEWALEKVTPKKSWEYYGNPLCYAYCHSVSWRFYRLYQWVSTYGEEIK